VIACPARAPMEREIDVEAIVTQYSS